MKAAPTSVLTCKIRHPFGHSFNGNFLDIAGTAQTPSGASLDVSRRDIPKAAVSVVDAPLKLEKFVLRSRTMLR